MKVKEEGIVFTVSRRAYLLNYIFAPLIIIFLIFLFPLFDFFNPIHFILFFSILGFAAYLIDESEIERWIRKYVIKENELVKLEGIFRKKRYSFPWQSFANITIYQGILGRILNYGNLIITIFGLNKPLIIKGVYNPKYLQNQMELKIAKRRSQ